jgi:membrane AbrB-like protein
MIIATLLANAGLITITLPSWLLTLAYAMIGWNIGLRFSRAIIVQAAQALPAVLLSAVALIACCGLFAMLLAYVTGIDPMTAYLATSPGGADSMAIIAAASHVDIAFVMSMQTCRLIAVIVFSPMLMRMIADHTNR